MGTLARATRLAVLGGRCQVPVSTMVYGLLLSSSVLSRQPTLFDRGEPDFDREFLSTHRVQLDEEAWVDLAPGWVTGHERLFDELASVMRWRSERRHMYERLVDVPRLLAGVPEGRRVPANVASFDSESHCRRTADCDHVPPALVRTRARS